MPNWVMNELTCIFQTKEELDAFKNKANTEGLYNSFIPMPTVLDGTRCPHLDPDAFIAQVNKRKGTNFLSLEGIVIEGIASQRANEMLKNVKAFIVLLETDIFSNESMMYSKKMIEDLKSYESILEKNIIIDEWDAEIATQLIQNLKAFEETGYHEWYAWNLDNWGVKWDAHDCKSKELTDFNTIIFNFNSPWGTPEHFVIKLSKLYPDATFEMVSGSIENDSHYEFTCVNGKFEETCSYDSFREAVEDGKWGGWDEWSVLLEESEEV
jgi:hypothetical protein